MPLVWAHAEYVRLVRSLRDGRVFDTPPQTVQRYVTNKTGSPIAVWGHNLKRRSMPGGKDLRILLDAPATVHWSTDVWATAQDVVTQDSGLGVFFTDLPVGHLPVGATLEFTFRYQISGEWENVNYAVQIS